MEEHLFCNQKVNGSIPLLGLAISQNGGEVRSEWQTPIHGITVRLAQQP